MQAATASISSLTYFQRPWLVPSLNGNRLPIVLGRGTARDGNAREPSASTSPPTAAHDQQSPDVPTLAVHPFASDRDAVYTFAGGDTVAVLQAGAHAVTVVRVRVTPVAEASSRTLLFCGEIDVDAERGQIVRMRGQFVVAAPHRTLLRRVITSSVETVAFAELENAEFDGRFWLPTFQRLEGQARQRCLSLQSRRRGIHRCCWCIAVTRRGVSRSSPVRGNAPAIGYSTSSGHNNSPLPAARSHEHLSVRRPTLMGRARRRT